MRRARAVIAPLLVVTAALILLPGLGGTSYVSAAGTFLVSNRNDSGAGSLRQAITDANNSGGGTVDATGVKGTITLLTALPSFDSNITLNGPGAGQLTVERSSAAGTPDFGIFAVNNGKSVSLSGLTIKNGSNRFGGGISNAGTVTITDCTVSGNTATIGGGIFTQGTLVVNGCTIANNTAESGGGINNFDFSVTISGSTVIDNSARQGGGLMSDGTVAINGSAFIHNSAQFAGGGVFNAYGALTITNSTFFGNAAVNGYGGAILNNNYAAADPTVSNSTIAGNTAGLGGGGVDNGGTLRLQSTIVAKNLGPNPDVSRSFVSGGNNLIGDTTGHVGAEAAKGDLLNVDPLFQQDGAGRPLLQDNGGGTLTVALQPESPAVDKGKNFLALAADQRGAGFSRRVDVPSVGNGSGDGTDIGAVELQVLLISGVTRSGKNLVVSGAGFAEGAKVYIDGEQRKTIYESADSLVGKKAAKGLPLGAKIKVRNPDGSESNEWAYQ